MLGLERFSDGELSVGLRISLQASDSCFATEEQIRAASIQAAQLPDNWQLMAHQVQTLERLRDPDVDIVINTAMTGDGKTLAAQLLPLLDRDRNAMFMYPTNELMRDQRKGLEETLQRWPPQPHWPHGGLVIETMNALELDKVQADLESNRASAVEHLLDSEILLTNPDIFHLLMQMGYWRHGDTRELLVSQIADRFRLFVFDEFHLFDTPQIAAALVGMLLLREISGGRVKFLFLSATPQKELVEWTKRAGLRVETVQSDYRHGADLVAEGWRRVLRSTDLHLWNGKLEDWVPAHLEDIIRFFAQHHPGAKGVIIANSVATAHRLYTLLREPLARAGISVGLNTGLTGQEERRISRETDLIIGTSTIDVGVDFRINLLIFESHDAASHMQRLGRLGRHEDDGRGHPFEHFEAHALLPEWVIKAVAEEIPAGESVERTKYQDAIRAAFPRHNQFEGYERRWGYLQAGHVLYQLYAPPIREHYKEGYKRLEAAFQPIFGGRIARRYVSAKKESPLLLNEAASFRGGSPFTVLVHDTTREFDTYLPYNLLTLLRHGEIEWLDLDRVLEESKNRRALERHRPLGACRLFGWLSQPRRVRFYLDAALVRWPDDRFGVAITRGSFRLDVPGVPGLFKLNRKLEDRELVATVVRGHKPHELRRRLRLGFQLQVHEFTSRDNVEGSVAFGRDALLLDTALRRSSLNAAGSSALIL